MVGYFAGHRKYRFQAGDTIVEVLIAIAVVSAVLVGAFVLSNHSTQAVQDSQEHAQAQQILQGQVEQLRAHLQGASSPVSDNYFCYDPSGHLRSISGPSPSSNPCAVDNRYNPVIYHATGSNLYDCTVTWDSLLGGTAREEFFYRVYPSS